MNGCLVNPAEMYKKEIAALTEELARVKERSKAAIQDLEKELAELKKNLNEERDLRKQVENNADELRDSLAKRELEQAELKKGVDEERQLPKQLETDADELPILVHRTDGPGVGLSEPMAIVQKPIVKVESPSIPNGIYIIKNRQGNVYWFTSSWNPSIFYITSETSVSGNINVSILLQLFKCSKDNCLSKFHWEIISDANGNISISWANSVSGSTLETSWVGAGLQITGSKVPWRLIAADDKFYQ